jgi:hypothetical protein
VRACRDGRAAEIIQECAPAGACSVGRCTTMACAAGEDRLSFLGCTFYTLDLDNVDADDGVATSVLVTNPSQKVARVVLERRVAGAWEITASTDVAPMRSARVVLPESHLEGSGVGSGTRITSDRPVSVVHVQSDGGGPGSVSTSSGATMLLPLQVLGQRYRAIAYKEDPTPRLLASAAKGSHGGAGQIVIVATADHTTVNVTPSATATIENPGADGGVSGSLMPLPPIVLDEGEYAQLYGASDGSNLSGTAITADHPIAVFSGNVSTTYGVVATGISSPDLTHEQLLPTRAWGRRFVGVVLPPQAGVCDPLLTPVGSSKLALVADRDDTNVTIRYAPMTVVPKTELAAGAWVEETTPRNFTLTASGPVEVMQGMDCEPTMSSAVPTERLHRDLYFAVLPGFDTTIAIVRREGRATYLDGARLEDSLFEPVGDGFDVLRVPLEECPASESVCTHHVQGEFGITMRGMDVLAAWSLTIPTWMPCDPDAAECL